MLTFSETVNTSTLDVSQIVVVNSATNVTQMFMLNNSASDSDYWPIITIQIGDSDLNEIKRLRSLATSQSTTFLQISDLTIRDTSDNMVVATNLSLLVVNYTADTTAPRLVSFSVDLSTDIVSFTFDETVNAATLDPTQLTFLSSPVSDPEEEVTNYTLTGGEKLSKDGTVLMLRLSFTDRNEIKRLTDLATSSDDLYASINESFVRDMNNNLVAGINTTDPLQVDVFTPDETEPTLLRFELNMDTRLLTLFFSETVNVSTLNISVLTFQSTPALMEGVTEYHTLETGMLPLDSETFSVDGLREIEYD